MPNSYRYMHFRPKSLIDTNYYDELSALVSNSTCPHIQTTRTASVLFIHLCRFRTRSMHTQPQIQYPILNAQTKPTSERTNTRTHILTCAHTAERIPRRHNRDTRKSTVGHHKIHFNDSKQLSIIIYFLLYSIAMH